MLCCTNCFTDTHPLLKNTINKSSNTKGKCSFCNSKRNFPLCIPSSLIDLFQPLFDLYVEESSGRLINELLHNDWKLFSRYIDKKKQLQLISNITGLKNLNSKKFISPRIREFTKRLNWPGMASIFGVGVSLTRCPYSI